MKTSTTITTFATPEPDFLPKPYHCVFATGGKRSPAAAISYGVLV